MLLVGWIVTTAAALMNMLTVVPVSKIDNQHLVGDSAPVVEVVNSTLEVPDPETILGTESEEVIEKPMQILVPKPTPVKMQEPASTKSEEKSCHSSYSGCLNPNASDYDCLGGSGNGPYYTGPVRVLGSDVFDLDHDNDGMACE